jgi:hypothetical protein
VKVGSRHSSEAGAVLNVLRDVQQRHAKRVVSLGHIRVDFAHDEPLVGKLLREGCGEARCVAQLGQGWDGFGVGRKVPVDMFGKQRDGQRKNVVGHILGCYGLGSAGRLATSPRH